MARIVKTEDKNQIRRIRGDRGQGEIALIGGGKLAYIWTPNETFSGVVTLRTLAYDILREVGFNRRHKRSQPQSSRQ